MKLMKKQLCNTRLYKSENLWAKRLLKNTAFDQQYNTDSLKIAYDAF